MNAKKTRYGIVIDSENCMSCYNCFMACRDEHCGFASKLSAPQPHEGQRWIDIRERERGDDSRLIKTASVPTPCSHCADPACMRSAAPGAVYIRDDGIVIIDPEKAIGQESIVSACPIGAVYWNDELKLPQKCTMCAELLDEGFVQPRCVSACPNGALLFGDLDDPDSEASKRIAQSRVTQLPGLSGQITNVVHVNIPAIFLAGSVCAPDDEVIEGAVVTLSDISKGAVYASSKTARSESGAVHASKGDKRSVVTNCFGDWEFEWLETGVEYELTIEAPGYMPFKAAVIADTDRYFGEVILNKSGN